MREIARTHPGGRGGLGRIVQKDMSLAVAVGRELGAALPIAEGVAERMRRD